MRVDGSGLPDRGASAAAPLGPLPRPHQSEEYFGRRLQEAGTPRDYGGARAPMPMYAEVLRVSTGAPLAPHLWLWLIRGLVVFEAPWSQHRAAKMGWANRSRPEVRISGALETEGVGVIASTQQLTQPAIYR